MSFIQDDSFPMHFVNTIFGEMEAFGELMRYCAIGCDDDIIGIQVILVGFTLLAVVDQGFCVS
jgi:hypothetical protein